MTKSTMVVRPRVWQKLSVRARVHSRLGREMADYNFDTPMLFNECGMAEQVWWANYVLNHWRA